MPAPLPTQRKLPLRGESLPLVLATVSEARALLVGCDEDDIRLLWEDGFLPFVWNIGLGYTTEPRIWPASLRHYAATLGSRRFEPTLDHVLSELLGACASAALAPRLPAKPYRTSTQVRLLLNCSATHVTNLIEERQLALVPGTDYQPGRHGAALITLDSLRAFFTSKRRLS